MYIAVSVVLCLIIVLLLYIAKNQRLELKERYLHSRHVVITIIYSAICTYGYALNLLMVNSFMFSSFFVNLLYIIAPSVNTGASFYWMVTLFSNILFLIPYNLILFLINHLWIAFIPKNEYKLDMDTEDANIIDRFFHEISGWFYNGNKIKLSAENIGVWIRGMKNIFALILIAEAIIVPVIIQFEINIIPEEYFGLLMKSIFMIPMAAYVVLSQVEIFLCADKSFRKWGNWDNNRRLIGDYNPLIELYQKYYGGKALISYYLKGEGDFTKSLFAGIEKEQLERVENQELFCAVYRNLERCIEHKSAKYIDSIIDMVNGKNVAVVDQVCGEFSVYMLSYLQVLLSQNKKTIVICDTNMQVEDVIKKYKEIFALINRVPSVWKIKKLGEMRDANTEILVCTEEELLTSEIRNKQPEFFDAMTNVIVVDSYSLMCRDKAFLTRLFNYVGTKDIQYVFSIPENNPDIKLILEEFLEAPISIYENYNETTNTCIMFWRSEAGYKTQNALSSNLHHDFGVAYTIALIALCYDVLDINIQSPDSVPIYTYRNTATDEYAKILSNEFFRRESINISSNIKVNEMMIFKSKELSFNVLYDNNNNLLSLVNMWLSYGGKECSMLHLVSRPYMLREYFAYNLTELHGKLSTVKLFVPIKVLNIKMAALAFLIKTRSGVYIEEIQQFAHSMGLEETNAEKILQYLIGVVFAVPTSYRVYECFSFDETLIPKFEDDKYVYSHMVRMSSEALYKELCSMTENNAVVINGTKKIVLPINKNEIYNYYLPGQNCAIGGERYHIDKIDVACGELITRKEESVFEDKEYTALYNITGIKDILSIDSDVVTRKERYSVNFFEAEITREIPGYYESSVGLNFRDTKRVSYVQYETPLTETKRASYMQLELSGFFGVDYEKVAALLTILVRGVLESLLPNNYRDLMVFSQIDKDEIAEPCSNDMKILDLIPTIMTDGIKKNSESAIYLYVVDYLTNETGTLTALADDVDRLFIIIKDYLTWVTSRADLNDHYLYFGDSKMPVMFDTKRLTEWLNASTTPIEHNEKILDGKFAIAASRYCAFCGRPVFASGIDIGGGRVMCEVCAKHGVKSTRKIERILRQAYNIIHSKYGAIIPPGIGIEFAPAAVVESIVKAKPGYVSLGVYVVSKHKIYVVKDYPEKRILATVIHELTHAWQHKEVPWILAEDKEKYCEGHTSYVEVQCMYEFDAEFASALEAKLMKRSDEYGEGYRYWVEYLKGKYDENIFRHLDHVKEL